MKRSGKERQYKSFDEYVDSFYPSSRKKGLLQNKEPYDIGEDLVRESLRKLRTVRGA